DPGGGRPVLHRVEVGRIGNEGGERSVPRVADHDAAQLALLGGGIAERGADIDRVVAADEHRARLAELRPGRYKVALLVEPLDAVVLAVGDVDAILRSANEYVVRLVEVAGRRPLVAPGLDERALFGELHDAGIAERIGLMAVGDKDVAIRRDR